MIDYPAARAVALIVQTGSFERAAAALNVTPSAISQRVRQLEERLGAVLVERGTPCTATEKGAWLCRHMEHVGMLEAELMQHLPGLVDPASPDAEGHGQCRDQCRQPGDLVSCRRRGLHARLGLSAEHRDRRRGPYRRLAAAGPGPGGGDVAGEAGAGLPRQPAGQAPLPCHGEPRVSGTPLPSRGDPGRRSPAHPPLPSTRRTASSTNGCDRLWVRTSPFPRTGCRRRRASSMRASREWGGR